jgi:hypothetical protein
MADDMDNAAQAFDNDAPSKPTDTVFLNLGKVEVDEESPAKGGGDDDEEALYVDPPKKSKDDPDEDEEEGPDDEGEDEDEEVDEEDDEDDIAAGKTYKVMIDGDEKEVSLKEALEGYIRTETFHKRMSEIDETNKIVYKAAQDVTQNFEYAKQMIDLMEGQMKELVPPEPDWDKLFSEDPAKARNLQKYYQQVGEFKGKLQEQRTAVMRQQAVHANQQLKAFADNEALRFSRINSKNWGTDPSKKSKDLQSMRRTAQQEGFSDEEIDQVFDSRMLMVLLKASKYDRMMAAKPKPVQQAAKPVTPGPGNKRTGRKGVNEAMKRLARSGSLEDAAPVFDQIMRRS